MGTGDPWAGHVSSRGSLTPLRRDVILVSCENFGEDPLIGSRKSLNLIWKANQGSLIVQSKNLEQKSLRGK